MTTTLSTVFALQKQYKELMLHLDLNTLNFTILQWWVTSLNLSIELFLVQSCSSDSDWQEGEHFQSILSNEKIASTFAKAFTGNTHYLSSTNVSDIWDWLIAVIDVTLNLQNASGSSHNLIVWFPNCCVPALHVL